MIDRRFKLLGSRVRDSLARLLYEIPDEPTHEVLIRPYRSKRSTKQNARIHAELRPYAEAHGKPLLAMKQYLNAMHMGGEMIEMGDGTVIPWPAKGTSDFTVEEASHFISIIQSLKAEEGIVDRYAF